MIDGEFLLETMHGKCYPNHPLGKHMLLIVLFVKARGENQYTVTEYSINLFFFSGLLFQRLFFLNMVNGTYYYPNVVEILIL